MPANEAGTTVKVEGKNYEITHGDVVIAAITSCTNTSNPSVLVAAGLVARKAHAKGLKPKPWVKTSLAPGSQVVTEYLDKSGLTADLDAIGFKRSATAAPPASAIPARWTTRSSMRSRTTSWSAPR